MGEQNDEKEKKFDEFNVFVGAETGILKGIHLNQTKVSHRNIHNLKTLDRDHEITSMAWGNQDQTEVLIGLRNKIVQVYDIEDAAFVSSRQVTEGEGPIVSLARWKGITLTALRSGQVTLWTSDDSPVEINAVKNLKNGETLARMRQSPVDPNIIATGGRENFLRLWDLEKPEAPTYVSKNVKPDFLQLRVPMWITDMTYMPDNQSIATSTRHKQIRLYDPKRMRRPVMDFEWGEYPLTCITAVPGSNMNLVVGAAHGRAAYYDLRGRKPDLPVHVFKSFAGGVRDIIVHAKHRLVFTASLDRFLRVHHLWSTRLLYSEYLKSRLNCLLVKDDIDEVDFTPVINQPVKRKKKKDTQDSEEKAEEKLDADVKIPKTKVSRPDSDWAALTI